MTVGRVSGINNMAYVPAVGRAGQVSMRPPVNPVTRIGSATETAPDPAAGLLTGPPAERGITGSIYYNSDGDSAEISNKAKELLQGEYSGGQADPLAGAGQPATGADTETAIAPRLDLPSPLIDWSRLPDTPEPVPAYTNVSAPVIAPPDTTPTIGAPPTSTPPETIPTAGAPPATAPPADAPPATAPPAGAPPAGAPPATAPPAGTPPVSTPTGNSPKGYDPESFKADPIKPKGECKTCSSRKYVDRSDDPSVSFQTPSHISPGMSGAAVASHEQEHVRNEQGNARRENREIVNQTVSLTYACCPECGRYYVSGGTTRTTSVGKSEDEDPRSGTQDPGTPPSSKE